MAPPEGRLLQEAGRFDTVGATDCNYEQAG